MAKRGKSRTLETWEVAIVKAMPARGENDQDILAHFTRQTRSVNHRVISEIRTRAKHKTLKAATEEELNEFPSAWPDLDPLTGLNLKGDELLIKSREAMIAAVHTFIGADLHFRAELFIVTAIIAWIYLLHAFYRSQNIDYRCYKTIDGVRQVEKTKNGGEKYWELSRCMRDERCPLDTEIKNNLEFLLELRHEIEHRSTTLIDDAIGAKLQACCINFNEAIKKLFGMQFGLERRLPLALQFATFSSDQKIALKSVKNFPAHLETMMVSFRERLTPEQLADPQFSYEIAFVMKTGNRAPSADSAVEFIKPGSDEALEISRILLQRSRKNKIPTEPIRS